MRQCIFVIFLALAGPGFAQSSEGGDSEGVDLFFDGLREQLGPLLEGLDSVLPQMEQMAESLGPLLEGLVGQVDDLSHYQMPERLPNGDIIIRRKPEAPDLPPEGQIDI